VCAKPSDSTAASGLRDYIKGEHICPV